MNNESLKGKAYFAADLVPKDSFEFNLNLEKAAPPRKRRGSAIDEIGQVLEDYDDDQQQMTSPIANEPSIFDGIFNFSG